VAHLRYPQPTLMTQSRPILIVDDVPSLRELIATVLTQAGFEVQEASSAEEALELANGEPPALVLLDVVLPDMSGYELCRTFRERYGEALPIIFVSGTRTDPLDSVAGLLVGADDYIVKPFVPEELVARVRRALTRSAELSRTNGATANGLTPREREVLSLLAGGLTQDEIADRLVISPKTVATHIQRILGKLEVRSRAQAVGRAYQLGLVNDVTAHMLVDDVTDHMLVLAE
jgi:DNA-binding NarL/FixJ family response regulator